MLPKKLSLFYVGYCIYFIALFVVEINYDIELSIASKVLKLIATLFFMLHLVSSKVISRKALYAFIPFFSLLSIIAFHTNNMHYVLMLVAILASMKEEKEKILCYSYTLLSIGILIVLTLSAFGVLPNNISIRGHGDTKLRYALGFRHSNVLPLMLFYLFSWRFLVRKKLDNFEIGFLIVCMFLLYKICGSRNGLMLCFALILVSVFQKAKIFSNQRRNSCKGFFSKLFCKYSVLILATISICMVFMYGQNPIKIGVFDELLSGRIRLSYLMLQKTGIHLINFMPESEYIANRIILDNGYIYTIIRYGILFVIFYVCVQFRIYDQHDARLSFIFAIATLGCFFDNDFFSYGFFPYILIAFHKVSVKGRTSEIQLSNDQNKSTLSYHAYYKPKIRVK